MGFWFQSNAPFNWASADNCGFVRDLRRRFKVCVAGGGRQHQRCRGEFGYTPLRPARKWHFQVLMAFSV